MPRKPSRAPLLLKESDVKCEKCGLLHAEGRCPAIWTECIEKPAVTDDASKRAREITCAHVKEVNFDNWHFNEVQFLDELHDAIATALDEAEQRGMMRAAEIARDGARKARRSESCRDENEVVETTLMRLAQAIESAATEEK